MAGPGTELKAMIPRFFKSSGCSCNDYAKKMDRWGADKCERNIDNIIHYLVSQASKNAIAKHFPSGLVRSQAEAWAKEAIRRSRESK